jgi:6-phosphogluconolactonase (cycloisomerase 2 family)
MRQGICSGLLSCWLLALVAQGGFADHPVVQQVVPRAEPTLAVAVSPTGNQLALADTAGITIFSLRSTGSIVEAPAVFSALLPGVQHLVFSPNGRYLFAVANNGLLHRLDRTNWRLTTTDLKLPGSLPQGICLLEDPSLLFISYSPPAKYAVVNYKQSKPVPEILDMPFGSNSGGGDVVARADGTRVFLGVRTMGTADDFTLQSGVRGIVALPWRYPLTSPYPQLAIGPDVNHILSATQSEGELRIFEHDTCGTSIIGCHLPGFHPVDLALSNDGVFLVLVSYNEQALRVVSGADLRARLDPHSGVTPESVRTDTVSLPHRPRTVALHPTLPVAYVTGLGDHKLMRVSLAIQGMTP